MRACVCTATVSFVNVLTIQRRQPCTLQGSGGDVGKEAEERRQDDKEGGEEMRELFKSNSPLNLTSEAFYRSSKSRVWTSFFYLL